MQSIRREFPDLPPIWALGTALVAFAAGRWLPLWRVENVDGAGIGLIAAGLALIVWSALWFRRKHTTIEPRDMPTALIVEGPFRMNRNPIYTGMAICVFGVAILSGGLSSLLVASVFPWIVTRRFILGEEAALRAAFGEEAERYFAVTRRW